MNHPGIRKPLRSADLFASLSGRDATPIVCAALALASFAVLLRIVSLW
jgi:hypothetical protein